MVNHSFGLHPELVNVPLVVSGDGVADDVDHGVVSLLDVHRTVADLAGVDVDSRGRNLLDGTASRGTSARSTTACSPSTRPNSPARTSPKPSTRSGTRRCRGSSPGPAPTPTRPTPTASRRSGSSPSTRVNGCDELDAAVDVREVADGDAKVDEDVRERLETLGYA